LDGGVEGGDVEGFEEDLGGGFAVGAGVEGGFGEEDWVLCVKKEVLVSCVQFLGGIECE